MRLDQYLDMKDLDRQIAEGMIVCRQHPTDGLAILNYTAKAQYTPELWTETTDKCRGLIYEVETNEISSRPFVKFWNYADSRHPETDPESFPNSIPTITRKMDGSLGIGYWSGGKLQIATRGSFESEQAKWATKWIATRQPPMHMRGFTFLFEIVYPENQIVVRYDWSGLALLAVVCNRSGEELSRGVMETWAAECNWPVVALTEKPLLLCVEEDVENEEGWVASWARPGTWPLRVKIKYATYCRLHKLLTQTSPKSIWEMLRDGRVDELEQAKMDAPEDFVRWVNEVQAGLWAHANGVLNDSLKALGQYGDWQACSVDAGKRKQFAEYAKTFKGLTSLMFAHLDGHDPWPLLWKIVKPVGGVRTFKADEE